jgi:hypothetical protein
MKLTLLELVQRVMSDIESDPVNTIGETPESTDVASSIRDTYFYIVSIREWPFLNQLSAFQGQSDSDNPTLMRMPEGMDKVWWVKYNKKHVLYKTPVAFKDLIDNRDAGTAPVDANGYMTDRDPSFWTTYDDDFVLFDSYDSDVDSTLQTSKSVVYASMTPSWTHDDDFTPLMPDHMFPAFLAECKAAAFASQKQTPNPREERRAKTGLTRAQSQAERAIAAQSKTNDLVNFGRK